MDYSQLATELAAHIRKIVRPRLGTPEARTVEGTANSGDATFNIDVLAEQAVVDYIKANNLNVAYYTEDAGLREFGTPQATLIIDPIDGTRGAMAGFECCVVSVAVADYKHDVCMRDVRAGCIHELKDDRIFVAERGQGVRIIENGCERSILKSTCTQIEKAGWAAEIAGRPASMIMRVIGKAIDASSIRGGFFIINSSAYSLTRLVTGQLCALVDVGGRLLADVEETKEAFMEAGFGAVVGLFPYDFAAAALIAEEAGCTITDAYGQPLDDVRLLDSSAKNIQSIIATCTPELHAQFMDSIEEGFSGFEKLWSNMDARRLQFG
ncbi:MAG: inositol monophosphatase family protein [Armatimonadota bacterium]|nr:hypothetical protein [bacterium]